MDEEQDIQSAQDGGWSYPGRTSPGYQDAKAKREQKRRPKPKDGADLFCRVCGDKAMGFNFDAVTCESCKAFFRRNALKPKPFTCSFDGSCTLDPHTRKFCSGCRLKKCITVGMKKEWILTDDQLAKRRQRVRETKYSRHPDSAAIPGSSPEVTSNSSPQDVESPDGSDSSHGVYVKPEPEDEDDLMRPLSEDVRTSIEKTETTYSEIFNAPYTETQRSRLRSDPRTPDELFNLTDAFIRRLIKFSKTIPEFQAMKQEDQISLLKGGVMEIMILRSAISLDTNTEKWKYRTMGGAREQIDPEVIQRAMGSPMYSEHIRFIKSLIELTRNNKTVMMLLFLIELFSTDRPHIVDTHFVAQGQEKYSLWLKSYLESIFPIHEAANLYPKLLMKLTDVRNLGEFSAKIASQIDISRMEPLLVEVFNLEAQT